MPSWAIVEGIEWVLIDNNVWIRSEFIERFIEGDADDVG
jgi:hypothetical protein